MLPQSDKSIIDGVVIRRSARARRISLSVRASGEVRLTIPINGDERWAMEFLQSRIEWIKEAQKKVASTQYDPIPSEEVEMLRAKAKGYLPQRVAEIANRYGFKYSALSIRPSRTRWGSCSSRNSITLSLFLMTLPPHLVDFVIIHELCHTIHHNHSQQFHDAVNKITEGRERELSRELKGYKCGGRRSSR